MRHASKLPADNPVTLYPVGERPRYPALSRLVRRSWRETRRAFGRLRRNWFDAIRLPDPRKDDDTPTGPLTPAQLRALDAATEQFLREFAGQDRTAAGFASAETEDGILQQTEFLAHEVGVTRGLQLVGAEQAPAFTASQRRRVLEEAFSRLSADGELRFERRLGEIRSALVQMFNDGASPLTVARELGTDLDAYERYRLRMLIRTEAAFASESAITGTLRAAGVQWVEIIGDPRTDEACTQWFGRKLSIDNPEARPPFHPFCYCSQVVWTENQ